MDKYKPLVHFRGQSSIITANKNSDCSYFVNLILGAQLGVLTCAVLLFLNLFLFAEGVEWMPQDMLLKDS